jgi:hypothetical protein
MSVVLVVVVVVKSEARLRYMSEWGNLVTLTHMAK